MSTIFWFSGTGNSLYVAKHIQAALGDVSLYPMRSGIPEETVGGKNEKIGFVFPSYFGQLPRFVRYFIETLNISAETYIFTVVTMAGMGKGSISFLDAMLKQKNLKLNYGKEVFMPGNNIIKYNPQKTEKIIKRFGVINKVIHNISQEIAAEKQHVSLSFVMSGIIYKDIETFDKKFFAEDNCTACGLCVKICPVSNIRMKDKRPKWRRHCERCVACISWCPVQAIQYGAQTKRRRRYQNPEIDVNELLSDTNK